MPDFNAQPSAAGGPENDGGESPEMTENGAANDIADDPAAAPEEAAKKASGDNDDSDEDLFDSGDDKGAAPPSRGGTHSRPCRWRARGQEGQRQGPCPRRMRFSCSRPEASRTT